MEWRNYYLDLLLVPSGILIMFGYHAWLWHTVRTRPLATIMGINSSGRCNWVASIMRDNEQKNILAVQTLRNTIMGSTLMATTSILLCSGIAAILSSTYSIKKPINVVVYGSHGDFMMCLKYVMLLLVFLFSFLCHSLSIRFTNQVNFLINTRTSDNQQLFCVITPDYVSEILEKGVILNTAGNRLFYIALPLLLWIFGPVLVFFCCIAVVLVLYNIDMMKVSTAGSAIGNNSKADGINCC
ncbi:hypothetical protein Droror1_Dr00002774 [Drosera rotundifolia]